MAAIPSRREPDLLDQTVVLIGGSSGIGLETARRARSEGASVVLTGRDRDRLHLAAREVGAERTAVFDANDPPAVEAFFRDLPGVVDHVMVTAGAPHYRPPLALAPEDARHDLTVTSVTVSVSLQNPAATRAPTAPGER